MLAPLLLFSANFRPDLDHPTTAISRPTIIFIRRHPYLHLHRGLLTTPLTPSSPRCRHHLRPTDTNIITTAALPSPPHLPHHDHHVIIATPTMAATLQQSMPHHHFIPLHTDPIVSFSKPTPPSPSHHNTTAATPPPRCHHHRAPPLG
ncbi:hypothetical protein Tco_0665029, partial [Tanacetum coccineum]